MIAFGISILPDITAAFGFTVGSFVSADSSGAGSRINNNNGQ
jgi:hypothetical protein